MSEVLKQVLIDPVKNIASTDKIFVSIACFCDPDVVDTVKDCLDKAGSPGRVEIGVCLQAKPSDVSYDALNEIARVTVDRIDVTEARGPIYARARCEALMTDADYFLQIDCHSRFFPGWDEILIREFAKASEFNEDAVLSHYPINIKNMASSDHLDRIGHVNRYRYIEADAIKSHGSLIKLPEVPATSLGISAAMLFMRAEDRRRFPYDPELDFGLHAAEQVLYAVRLWTHGFDIFCPTRHALATDYEGSRDRIPDEVKRISNANRTGWPEATWSKVKYLLGLDDIEQVDPVYGDSLA
ncbi:MAG: GlcNAc-transferase family protein, partial [Pseudomonadota bacterium]|nr:GlcNAc-transferase family protein [Pseudomonadota bacterium]